MSDIEPDDFTGPAVEEFGAEAVMDAYCETAGFFHERAVTSLTVPELARPADAARGLAFVDEHLSVTAAQDWHRAVAEDDTETLNSLLYYRLPIERLGYAYPSGRALNLAGEASTARADVVRLAQGRPGLALWFTVTNHLAVVKTGDSAAEATHQIPLVREVAVQLTPNPDVADDDHTWLIDSWRTTWHTEPAKRLTIPR